MHMSAAASAGPAKTTSALSDSILGAQVGAPDDQPEDDGETAGENAAGALVVVVVAMTAGMNKVGLTDPRLQASIIISLLIVGLILFLTFVAPQIYNMMADVTEFSDDNLGYWSTILIVGTLAVACANPMPGSHVTLLFIAYHYGVPVNREEPALGGACESTGFLFLNATGACFLHGAGFLYGIYTIGSVVNFTLLRHCCGECANREAKKKGGDYVIAVDSVISAGGWQTFQAMMLLRMTPIPIGLQTLTLSVTSIGAPIEKRGPSPEAELAAAQAGKRSTMVPGQAEAAAAADGSLLAEVLGKTGWQIGWPYMAAALIGNIKMAAFDALVGVNVNALDKAANGKSDDHTELVILMIGLGGLIAIIGIVGVWAKKELDSMHRQSVGNSSLGSMDLEPNTMDLDPSGVENPVSSAGTMRLRDDDDPIVLAAPVEQEQAAPPSSPVQIESSGSNKTI